MASHYAKTTRMHFIFFLIEIFKNEQVKREMY
jgi:hypothetical protein